MINQIEIYEELQSNFDTKTAQTLTKILTKIYEDMKTTVTRQEFSELQMVVKELAEAQKRTEQRLDILTQRLDTLAQKVEELAEAQKRTEKRVEELAEAQKRTEKRVEELAEAQKRTEQRLDILTQRLDTLAQKVEELAEAQKRTEKRIEELAEAQKRSEQKIEALAEAQRKTEKRIDVLSDRVEGISNTFGYALENITCKHLPSLLLKEDGVKVQGKIIRRYYERKGEYNQINIFARVTKDGKDMLMLGEVKTRPSKTEIDRFIKIAEYIKKVEGNPEVYLVFVAHDYHPKVEHYLKEKDIRYFWSYDLESQNY